MQQGIKQQAEKRERGESLRKIKHRRGRKVKLKQEGKRHQQTENEVKGGAIIKTRIIGRKKLH